MPHRVLQRAALYLKIRKLGKDHEHVADVYFKLGLVITNTAITRPPSMTTKRLYEYARIYWENSTKTLRASYIILAWF